MQKTEIELDKHRVKRMFPTEFQVNGWSEGRLFLTGRLPARLLPNFVEQWREIAVFAAAPVDAKHLDRLNKRQRELSQYIAERKQRIDQADPLTADPAELAQADAERAAAERMMRGINAELNLTESAEAARAERHDFAQLVLRLADVEDLRERAKILDSYGLLSADSRRELLEQEPADQAA